MKKILILMLVVFFGFLSQANAAQNLSCKYEVKGNLNARGIEYFEFVQDSDGKYNIYTSKDGSNYTKLSSKVDIYPNDVSVYDSVSSSFKSCPSYSSFNLDDDGYYVDFAEKQSDNFYGVLLGKNDYVPDNFADTVSNGNLVGEQEEVTESEGCEGLLGVPEKNESERIQTPAYYLQFVFNVMKYIAIILLFVLSIIDLVKAASLGKDDEIKKVGQNCVKRLIICIIIFFLPNLVEFLFKLMGIYGDPTCGIK